MLSSGNTLTLAIPFTMTKIKLLLSALGTALVVAAVMQIIPAPPVLVPAQLPEAEREKHRLLNFAGIDNFRDLGGYATQGGQRVKWGLLYRSGTWHGATTADIEAANSLGLATFIDLRSTTEKELEQALATIDSTFMALKMTLLSAYKQATSKIMDKKKVGN